MSINTFTWLRSTICVMVLLAIVTALLPAQGAAADQQTVVLTAQELREQVYDQWAYKQGQRTQHQGNRTEEDTFRGIVSDQMLHDVSLDPDVVVKQAELLREGYIKRLGPRGEDPTYRASLPFNVSEEAMFAAALEMPNFRASANRFYQERKQYASQALETLVVEKHRPLYQSFVDSTALEDASRAVRQEQIAQVYERAATSEDIARAWDAVFEPTIGVKLEDFTSEDFDIKAFLIAHPEADMPQEVQNAIKPDGSLEMSLNDLDRLTRNVLDKVNASIDDTQKTIGAITKNQGELVDFKNNAEARKKAKALAEARFQENQKTLQTASSAISIISSIVSRKYPERGKQINVIGQSVISVGQSLNSWMKDTATLGTLSKIGSLSSVVLTGNVIAAAMNIFSLFGPQQPTPEQMILEEIGKLRQQVNELRTEMHDRFDRVDAQLNTIYSTMNDRFNQIDIQLGKINGKLDDIQQSLLTLGMQLDRIERNNFEFLDVLGRRPLRESINGALGYKQRTGVNMPYQPDFVNYENTFHTWATVNAFDSLSAGPNERDYSDGAVLRELSTYPLDANLNYLNGWLQAHGMQPFANKRLPGLRDWTFASHAYADIGFDWPDHLKRISKQRQDALDAVGNDLEQALQNISTIQTPSGPQGNAPLFSGLNAYYTSKLAAMDGALAAEEAAFVKDVQTALNHPVGFDLYGGVNQILYQPYSPADFMRISCGVGVGETLRTPQHLKFMLADYNRWALAEYLGVRPLKLCLSYQWVGETEQCVGKPPVCETYADPQVMLTMSSNNVELFRSVVRDYRQKKTDIHDVVVRDWDLHIRPQFEAMFGSGNPAPPLSPAATVELASLSGTLANKLAELQRTYMSRVLSSLSSGSLRASAVELAGAKKLLESFVTLGFSRAAENDDLLHSLLFSQEAIIDDQLVALAYTPPAAQTLAATAAISEAQLLVNPRIELQKASTKRREAFNGLLTDYLGNISTANYQEDNALVAGARFDMLLARTFADQDASSPTPGPAPGQSRVVFLPLVRR